MSCEIEPFDPVVHVSDPLLAREHADLATEKLDGLVDTLDIGFPHRLTEVIAHDVALAGDSHDAPRIVDVSPQGPDEVVARVGGAFELVFYPVALQGQDPLADHGFGLQLHGRSPGIFGLPADRDVGGVWHEALEGDVLGEMLPAGTLERLGRVELWGKPKMPPVSRLPARVMLRLHPVGLVLRVIEERVVLRHLRRVELALRWVGIGRLGRVGSLAVWLLRCGHVR